MRKHGVLIGGAVCSALLLAIFLVLQERAADLLQLPAKWLWVALVPLLVSVVAGGYIVKFKATSSGVEFELPDNRLKRLPKATHARLAAKVAAAASWQEERAKEYDRTSELCLVHVYTPSQVEGQVFDAFIYLVRHQKDAADPKRTGLSDVIQVEFYFGASWEHQVFTVVNSGSNILGVRAHAFGTFLATCRVTFVDKNRQPVILHRYIDCEMLAEKTA
jgi:uncharacterized integral membrane protein